MTTLHDEIKPDITDNETECPDCCGKGWNDVWHAVSGHFEGGEYFKDECETCAGTGVVKLEESE